MIFSLLIIFNNGILNNNKASKLDSLLALFIEIGGESLNFASKPSLRKIFFYP